MLAFRGWAGIQMLLHADAQRLEPIVPNLGTAGYFRSPQVGTHGCQRGNRRLAFQGTAGSQRLELLVANLGTTRHHCKQLPGTASSQSLKLMVAKT